MWLLGFEPRSPRPQRGILTTKLQPQDVKTLGELYYLSLCDCYSVVTNLIFS